MRDVTRPPAGRNVRTNRKPGSGPSFRVNLAPSIFSSSVVTVYLTRGCSVSLPLYAAVPDIVLNGQGYDDTGCFTSIGHQSTESCSSSIITNQRTRTRGYPMMRFSLDSA